MTQRRTAVGVFRNRQDAERAVDELHRAGFTDEQIGVAARDDDARSGTQTSGGADTKGEEGGLTGMLAGAGIGGVIGAAAVGLIPGIGPVIAAGALAGILGGAAAGAATGGLVGWLAGQGVPEEEARHYESEVKAGRTLVTVQADGRYDEAAAILQRGGSAIRSEATRSQVTDRTADKDQLELREEQLHVRKQPVESGEVTIGKDVVTERQTMEVPVTHEEVEVEYHPVEPRTATSGDVVEGDVIRVPVREEKVQTNKETVVTGEVSVRKRQVQGTEEVTDTVRKEKPRVNRKGDVNLETPADVTGEEPRP